MRKRRIAAKVLLLSMLAGIIAGCGSAEGGSLDIEREGDYVGNAMLSGGADGSSGLELPVESSGKGFTGEGACDDMMAADGAMDSIKSSDKVSVESEAMPGEYSGGGEGCEYFPGKAVEPQAGLLTAGEWRDNENWGFFANLVRTGRFGFRTFGIVPYERVVVQALSGGQPAGQVKVELNTVSGSAVATAVTDHKGRAYLYYNVYGETQQPDHVVLIRPDGSRVQAELPQAAGQEPMGNEVPGSAEADGNVREALLPSGMQDTKNQGGQGQTRPEEILNSVELTVEVGEMTPPVKSLDVMFVFDTTGSMGDELLYLQKEFEDIAKRVADQSTRFSVNFYRDQGDEYVVRSNPFSDDIEKVQALINAEYATGGGDYEEAVDLALLDAVTGHEWREGAVKLAFLILDAPPHDTGETAANLRTAMEEAIKQGIRIIPIASSGVDEKTEGFLRGIAMLTGGTYTFLTDDSGIGGSHLEPTVGAYTVEALNDMIVRLIKEYYGE